jgi:hypothetical protein
MFVPSSICLSSRFGVNLLNFIANTIDLVGMDMSDVMDFGDVFGLDPETWERNESCSAQGI